MKHIPAPEDGPWRSVCAAEPSGLKKLRRRGREPARRASGGKTFRADLAAPAPRADPGAASAAPAGSPGGRALAAPGPRPRAPPRAAPPGPAASPGSRPGPDGRALQQTRRLLANARERTRVHTISAAFEALRKQVPCYSYGQKLSKLAILRIACNYILSLARLADLDYSADRSNLSFSECVQRCTRTLQAEGRAKKRKE